MDVECIPDDGGIQSVIIVKVCVEKANAEHVSNLLTEGGPSQLWYNDISVVNKSSAVLEKETSAHVKIIFKVIHVCTAELLCL